MNWSNFEFNSPEFFWLFALIPFVILWRVLVRKRSSATLTIPSVKGFKAEQSIISKLKPMRFIVRISALCLLILAFARPRNVAVCKKTKTNRGIDIVMAIDVSASMQARDLKQNRLETLTVVGTDLVNKRPNDRIRLVL